MESLSIDELCTINGGSEVSHFIIKMLSFMFYSEAIACMNAEAVGGVANVIAFK